MSLYAFDPYHTKIIRKTGYDASLKFMGHLWEPMQVVHLPLVMYAAMELLGCLTGLALWCMGFSSARDRETGIRYWIYDPLCDAARAAVDGGLGGRIMHVSRHQLQQRLHRLHDSVSSLIDLDGPELRHVDRTIGSAHQCLRCDIMLTPAIIARHCSAVRVYTSAMYSQCCVLVHTHKCMHAHKCMPAQLDSPRMQPRSQPVVFLHGVMGIGLCLPLIRVRCPPPPLQSTQPP